MKSYGRLLAGILCGLMVVAAGSALAAAPQPWQLGMQPPATPVGEMLDGLHDMVNAIMVAITVFVLVLLLIVAVRFNARANPTPSKRSHNTPLEIFWTVVPILILVVIAIPSFRLLYYQDRARDPDMTLQVTAFQWAWEYAYPDQGDFRFESRMIPEEDLKPGQLRNLAVDEEIVVPAGKTVRVLTTSRDVIHSFYLPSFGIQKYAIPGRTLETWFRVEKPGVYYGQCNQICGTNHAFMPIVVHAVPEAEFKAWAEQAKTRYAQGLPPAPVGSTALAQAAR